jgi:DNA-binding beta-propeller fold protein YncE
MLFPNGKVQWEFYDEHVLVSPTGITTDNNNNIYVVSEGSNSLVVISPDGQNYKALLSDRDELNLPWTIYCDRASNQLLLTNRRDDNGLLYDISTTPT